MNFKNYNSVVERFMPLIKTFVLRNKLNITIFLILSFQTLLTGRWWLWNLFSIIPPLFFSLLYLLLILWNLVKANRAGFLFVVLSFPLFIYNSDISFQTFSNQVSENSENITVFNWNTQFWVSDNKEEFYNYLLSQKANVYHLQEHIQLGNNTFIELNDLEEIKSIFKGYTIIKKTEFLTITNLPVIESFEEQNSYYLRVDVQVNNNILSLYNVHIPVQLNPGLLSSPVLFVKDLQNRFYFREREFNKLINDVKSNKNEFYISGDFNTTRSMGKIHEVLSLGKDAIHTSNNVINGSWQVYNLKLWRIDYNIVHNGLKVISYQDINPLSFSDHWAQLVEIQL